MRKKNKNISDITVKDVKNYFIDERLKINKYLLLIIYQKK
jgi:hypothetical protein